MAKKISELSAGTALTGTEKMPMVQGGETKYTTPDQIKVKCAILYDEKSSGTDGGTATAGDNDRVLNSENDPDNIVSLSSNKFVPIAGDFYLEAVCPASDVGRHRARLYNVTAAANVAKGAGTNAYSAGGGYAQTDSVIKVHFTANGTDEYKIIHYVQNTASSIGFGNSVDDGNPEQYTKVTLWKIK